MRPAEAQRVGASDIALDGEVHELGAHRCELLDLLLDRADPYAQRTGECAMRIVAVARLGDVHHVLDLFERQAQMDRTSQEVHSFHGVLAEEPVAVLAASDGTKEPDVGIEPDSAGGYIGMLGDSAHPEEDFSLQHR